MKYFYLFFFILLLDFQASAVSKNWTGATNSDWNTASNWSPSGVPGPGDDVYLFNVTNAPQIFNGTTVTINDLEMRNRSTLTVAQGASLNVIRNSANFKRESTLVSATIFNYGTIVMQKTRIGAEFNPGGFILLDQAQIHNYASLNIKVPGDAIIFWMASTGIFTNYGTGMVTLDSDRDIQYYDPGQFINRGMLISKGVHGAFLTSSGRFTNYGIVQMSGRFVSGGIAINQPCGMMVVGSVDAISNSFTNSGFVYITGGLNSGITRFTNNGLVKYGSLNGAYANNHIGIADNADPIFALGPQVNEIIEGIYLDQEADAERAGVYIQSTNTFTPNPELAPGPITLYVLVQPADGGCSYMVPFEYTVTPLPVKLISFSGKKGLEHQNQLKWVTSDEKGFDRFDVERSVDAKSFETIGSVRGAAKKSALQNYSFEDYSKGDAYYRLKMVDTDRTFTYSRIIYVHRGMHDPDQPAILGPFYPNPALGGGTTVDLFSAEAGSWIISVLDISGKVIRSESKVMQKGMNKTRMDQLPEGLYLIRFENQKETIIRKLVSQ